MTLLVAESIFVMLLQPADSNGDEKLVGGVTFLLLGFVHGPHADHDLNSLL